MASLALAGLAVRAAGATTVVTDFRAVAALLAQSLG